MRARPVLRYHGGKWMLAPWIISHFPKHRCYVEPFGGGGSVLMRKPRTYAEIYNDRWGRVVDVFRVLRDPDQAAELCRRVRLTPFARSEFEEITEDHLSAETDVVERVRLTIFRSMAGFGSAATNGAYSTGFRANSNRSGTTPAQDWMNYPEYISGFVERLRGVVVENRPAAEVIVQHDGSKTLHYVDPPYLHEARNMNPGNASYAFEMTDDDHAALAHVLHRVRGMVVLSGYPTPLYDEDLYRGWTRITREALADGARKRTEVLWLNEAAKLGLENRDLF